MIKDSPVKSLNILDVGGTEIFWDIMQFKSTPHRITLLNLDIVPTRNSSYRSIAGDARHMPEFKDKEFDIVFSNSVIEHVGSFADQQAMANEIRRVGIKYFLQTPSYLFPFEPHFLFPFFHWLPITLRTWLVSTFHLGWYGKNVQDWNEAKKVVTSIRLLKESELRILFPDAVITKEKFFGLTKSFILVRK
jgi:Methyltransferase domain